MVRKYLAKKRLTIALIAVFLAFSGFGGTYLYATQKNASALNNCNDNCVQLGVNKAPEVLTVTTGSYVQFKGLKGAKHNIALEHAGVQHEDPSEYESGDFNGDEAWKVQFKKDGSYTFRDKYNKYTKINVIVYTEEKDYSLESSLQADHAADEKAHYSDGHSH